MPPPLRVRHEENAPAAAQRRRDHLAPVGPRSQARDSAYFASVSPSGTKDNYGGMISNLDQICFGDIIITETHLRMGGNHDPLALTI